MHCLGWVAVSSGWLRRYSERMCLHARTFLVAMENRLGWPGELN